MEKAYPNITYINTGSESVQYKAILDSYWNLPDALPPNCFIQPRTTEQVSKAVSILSKAQCKFAVKSGGHMLLVGSNGIQKGVTIDLRGMRRTTLSADKQTVSVQPGAKWGDVYTTLDPLGYAIPGGRSSDVGVGGLVLGGGNSFFAARYGFVCDNVKNFEIVLGNGTITTASAKSNPDLFKALKGASGNLGIVTRFDFYTFRSADLWGGLVIYAYSSITKLLESFVDFTNNIATDPYGSLITFWQHTAADNSTVVLNLYEYTGNASAKHYYQSIDPPGTNNPVPAPFTNFTFQKLGKPIQDRLRVASLYNFTAELNGPTGIRNIYSAVIFKATTAILTEVDAVIYRVLQRSQSNPPYTVAETQYQPIPRIFTDHSIQRGGNMLGLDRVKDNSILLSFILHWENPAQDAAVRQLMGDVLGNVTRFTKEAGGFRPWQYVNYAYEDQDPLGSYGEENVRFMQRVSRKYDQKQVFQKLVPGGWKLGDAGKRRKDLTFNEFGAFAPR